MKINIESIRLWEIEKTHSIDDLKVKLIAYLIFTIEITWVLVGELHILY